MHTVWRRAAATLGLLFCATGCLQHASAYEVIDYAGPPAEGDGSVGEGGVGGDSAAENEGGMLGEGGTREREGATERNMPSYYNFITTLRQAGFTFMSFGDFWAADKAQLPEKLIVVRHDVHHRDIPGAYDMHAVEKALLSPSVATYFVMLGFAKEANDPALQQDYLDLIAKLAADGTDVQPHISPNDLYVDAYKPSWRKKSARQLASFISGDYQVVSSLNGVDIETVGKDVLDMHDMNTRLIGLLARYNSRWHKQTGLVARYYAAHGSHIAVNLVINNATILDQHELLASGVYEFDTYNTRVHEWLTDLSDNEQPDWMDHPETIAPGRYQLLAHPRLWTPELTEKREEREAGWNPASRAAN